MSFILLAFVANNLRFELLGDDLHLGNNPGLGILNADLALVVIEIALALVFRIDPYGHAFGLQSDDFPSRGILRLGGLDKSKLFVSLNELCPLLQAYRGLLGLGPIFRSCNVQIISSESIARSKKKQTQQSSFTSYRVHGGFS